MSRTTFSARRRQLLAAPAFAWPAVATAHVVQPWPARRAVPALALPDLDGKLRDLSAQRGRAVLLNFWASWCEPCRDELPSLALAATRHEADGLLVWLVNYQEGSGTIRRFVERWNVDLPVLLDADGQATKAWTPRVFPTSVMIGADGRPRQTVLGEVDWGAAEPRRWLQDLLRAAPPPR